MPSKIIFLAPLQLIQTYLFTPMRSLLLLLFIATQSFAQIHTNQPLPEIQTESAKVIDEGITGWSLSLDGQWISKEMVIPVRGVAANTDYYEEEVNALGLDNISELILYPTKYGEETVYILVKVMHTGKFKYEATKQKWQGNTTAYYYVFDGVHFDLLKNIDQERKVVKIPLRDFGSLGELKTKEIPEKLQQHLVIRPQTDQVLVATIKLDSEASDKIYFQLSSQDRILSDVEGIVQDFMRDGRTLYGSPFLTDYLHYEYDKNSFYSFFSAQ